MNEWGENWSADDEAALEHLGDEAEAWLAKQTAFEAYYAQRERERISGAAEEPQGTESHPATTQGGEEEHLGGAQA